MQVNVLLDGKMGRNLPEAIVYLLMFPCQEHGANNQNVMEDNSKEIMDVCNYCLQIIIVFYQSFN